MSVRVRFAPSPTGYLHVGGIRTAIFNYFFARKLGGVFVLRIDDTDIKRHHDEAVQVILDGLKWMGLEWDEGPEKGGAYGPYFQGQRFERYKAVAKQLEDAGRAYWAKKEAPKELPAWKIEKLKKAGKWDEDRAEAAADPNPALYFKFHPGEPKEVVFRDAVWGEYRRPAEMLDDYVILRGDGTPTYNFATVVDDIDMQISHVIRGEDHLANTPKQINLFEALGAPLPVFAHLPMIHNDKAQKISKRRDPVAVTLYRDAGILPEALFNFLALLGWSPGDDRELMSKDEMTAAFDLERIKHAPAQFALARKRDLAEDAGEAERVGWLHESLPGTKLEWMNGEYLKKLPVDELLERVFPFLVNAGYPLRKGTYAIFTLPHIEGESEADKQVRFDEALAKAEMEPSIFRTDTSGTDSNPLENVIVDGWLKRVLALEQERSRTLLGLAENVRLFFEPPKSYDSKAVAKFLEKNDGWAHLEAARALLGAASDWSPAALEQALNAYAESKGAKFGAVAQPLRVALAGVPVSPPIHDTLALLGKDEALRRIDALRSGRGKAVPA
ncbi:MAG: glutamate--tRNA ligase [Planctomycetota bacterium]|nr:glutamate--tRNA ligase [Planctomycetota bacterium]